jgi:hypothetical protein
VALAAAVSFAVLLNAMLVISFLSPYPLPSSWNQIGWCCVVVFWATGVGLAVRGRVWELQKPVEPDQEALFIRAQTEYLRGHWVESQSLLKQLLRRNPQDVEAHLLLASVHRRAQRIDMSRRQLRRIGALEGAEKWRLETERERAVLEGLSAATSQHPTDESREPDESSQVS